MQSVFDPAPTAARPSSEQPVLLDVDVSVVANTDRGIVGVGAHVGIRTRDLFLTKEVLYRLSYVGQRTSRF